MSTRYVPILRWKQGERIALRHLSVAGRTNVVPHFVIAQAQFGLPKRRKKKPAAKSAKKAPPSASEYLSKQLHDIWGNAAFYVDASDLPGTLSAHTLDDLRTSADALSLQLVPSIRLNAPTEYVGAVRRATNKDGRGAGLRISLAQLTSASSWIGSWPIPLAETDLMVDLGGSVGNVLALGQSVHLAFQSLHQANLWRSVTVTGGNIPATLSGYFVGLTMLPRAELQLWSSLRKSGLPYALDFGDYATIGPDSTTENIEGPVPINAKYTCKPDFAVFHGVKTKGPGSKSRDQQYRSYASQVVKLANRGALAHCWGDKMVDGIASSSTSSPGSPSSWVSYSVNRHIELTRSQLP